MNLYGGKAMSKKQFKDSPALAFINPQEKKYDDTQYNTQQETQERVGYIRTQGRKGFKKPRINLAFDSEIFLNKIRDQADKEGKSITQLVNDVIADYLKKCERINKK
jgi:hypothetical protein